MTTPKNERPVWMETGRVKRREPVLATDGGFTIEVPLLAERLDLFPRSRANFSRQRPEVGVIGDCFGIGTTTATKVVSDQLRVLGLATTFVPERTNVHLAESYEGDGKGDGDKRKAFFRSQISYADDNFYKPEGSEATILLHDRPIEGDLIFAKAGYIVGKMIAGDYIRFVDLMLKRKWSRELAPTVMIYLQLSDELIPDRVNQSAEEFERGNIPLEYLLTLKAVGRDWMAKAIASKYCLVLPVNIDNFNFTKSEAAQLELTRRVVSLLVGAGWHEYEPVLHRLQTELESVRLGQ